MRTRLSLFLFLAFTSLCVQAKEKTCEELNNPNLWLWPNAYSKIQEAKQKSETETLYLLQGNFSRKSHTFIPLGVSPHPLRKTIVLVYRLQTLPKKEDLLQVFQKRAEAWRIRGTEVVGLQVDFDSPTLKLKNYSSFLLQLKKELPEQYTFSITGLVDWINNSQKFQQDLKDQAIAVFYQFYQERTPHKNSAKEVLGLRDYSIPFYIGFLPQQAIPEHEINILKKNQHFKGVLCFYGEKM